MTTSHFLMTHNWQKPGNICSLCLYYKQTSRYQICIWYFPTREEGLNQWKISHFMWFYCSQSHTVKLGWSIGPCEESSLISGQLAMQTFVIPTTSSSVGIINFCRTKNTSGLGLLRPPTAPTHPLIPTGRSSPSPSNNALINKWTSSGLNPAFR